ncbi:hypothetical protein FXB41_08150 [Bradyrhizobium canariense]|jgi:hypothetical protein|uniref:hypothetical protein n=1 Tax=Bradyrhizobium TaxID=374 RepID=UPI00025D2A4B|nr:MULTISPECIES: hypothetical protein [Bradyrhizobium]EIG60818.1 hypothetical protein Bra1253DRAFT_05585 [Bradyrhizobium sp. WSM1253]MBW5434754.1 hypothetical protein [Bradyrhizobium canariense]
MTGIKFAIAALITVGLATAPSVVEAKKHRSARHYSSVMAAPSYGSVGGSMAVPSRAYGSSGQTVGTVTAPSIGTYNWPSVGVTNSVPTWSNTNPPVR